MSQADTVHAMSEELTALLLMLQLFWMLRIEGSSCAHLQDHAVKETSALIMKAHRELLDQGHSDTASALSVSSCLLPARQPVGQAIYCCGCSSETQIRH
jgi:hypothetical protein